jgi:sulfur carrier protein
MITISLNGQRRELESEPTVAEMLEETGVKRERVAVLLNEEVVPKARHADTRLKDGDALELITLAGGG